MRPLLAFFQAVREKVVQFGNRVDLVRGLLNRVLDPDELEVFIREQRVACAGVHISGLANTANIHHHFFFRQRIGSGDFRGADKPAVRSENPGNMCVTLKAILRNHGKDFLNLPLIVDVFREDIFIQGGPD